MRNTEAQWGAWKVPSSTTSWHPTRWRGVACLRPDGAPYVVPIWYQWDGTSLWFVGRERSEWCRFMQNDPRISVVIDKEHGRPDAASGEIQQIPKVIASGNAEIVETPNVGGQVGRHRVEDGVALPR